eukprot:g8690.t1
MLRSLRRLGRSSSLHPRGTGPYLQAPQRRRALERPGITAREGHGELTAFDVEASELSGFALRLARRTRAAEGSDAGLREAWSSVAFQTEGLIQALSLEEAYDLLRALSKGGVLTRFTSCVKRLMTHVADQEEFLRPRKVLTLWRLLDRADLIDAVEATSYFEKELKFAYKLEAGKGSANPSRWIPTVPCANAMGVTSAKCQSCDNCRYRDEDADGLPGVSIAGHDLSATPSVDSPTQRMSDLSPTSATSPTSRSRVESGNTTTMMEDEDVDWLQRVTQAVGAKNASERDQLSKELGGTINLMLDVEQEELNREELRVERISRRISRKQVNDSKLRTSAATAEKMVDRLNEAESSPVSEVASAASGPESALEDNASTPDNEKQRLSLQKNITKAIAFDHGAIQMSERDTEDHLLLFGTAFPCNGPAREDRTRVFRKNLRRTASNLSLMSTLGRDVSERLKIIVENPREINAFYEMDQHDLGRGSYGAVKRAKVKGTGATRAVKVIGKDRRLGAEGPCTQGFGALKNEIFISKKVDHPNVVKLYEIFEDNENLYLVLELCSAGHLFAYIRAQRSPLKDHQSVVIMRQVLQGECGSDISRDAGNSLRISDFGLSCEFEPGQVLTAQVGTTAYMAPQVLLKSYTEICDVWSCGVILHILLSGFLPFLGRDASKESIRREILRGKLKMPFGSKMLKVNPEDRLTAQQACQHPYLNLTRRQDEPPVLPKEDVLEGLQSMHEQNVKAALHLIVTMLHDEHTSIPRNTFMKLDANGDGLELEDFYGECSALDPAMFHEEGREAHGISYTTFLAATFDKGQWVGKQVCKAAFTQFDSNGDLEVQDIYGRVLHDDAWGEPWGIDLSEKVWLHGLLREAQPDAQRSNEHLLHGQLMLRTVRVRGQGISNEQRRQLWCHAQEVSTSPSLKSLSTEGLVAALRCAAHMVEGGSSSESFEVDATFVESLSEHLLAQAQWLHGWQASHVAAAAAQLGLPPGRCYDRLRQPLMERSVALRASLTAPAELPTLQSRPGRGALRATRVVAEADHPNAPEAEVTHVVHGLAEVERLSAALATFDTQDVEVRDLLAKWLLQPLPARNFARISWHLASVGLNPEAAPELCRHVRARARSSEVVSALGLENSQALAEAYRVRSALGEKGAPRSGRSKRERRIYDLFFQPGSHEVLYETLKLFADRSDARAAVNALCSLARLDNQRLEQVTKPGQRPARGSGNFTSKLALEAEAALCQRLERLLEQRESLPPLFVANFLWSVAKVAAREPPKFTARDLSTALWALAVLVADTPHRNVADTCALPGFLSQRLCLLAGYRELKTFDLTQSLWAAAKLANQGVPGMAKLMLELVKAALGEASTFDSWPRGR